MFAYRNADTLAELRERTRRMAENNGHQLLWGAPLHADHEYRQTAACRHCSQWAQIASRPDDPEHSVSIIGQAPFTQCPKTYNPET